MNLLQRARKLTHVTFQQRNIDTVAWAFQTRCRSRRWCVVPAKDSIRRLNGIEVLVRTDATVPWSADPAKTKGLFLFTDSEEDDPNIIGTAGDGLDVRVLFKYLSGAFDPIDLRAHGWKTTPELLSLRVTYLDQTRVLTREEWK